MKKVLSLLAIACCSTVAVAQPVPMTDALLDSVIMYGYMGQDTQIVKSYSIYDAQDRAIMDYSISRTISAEYDDTYECRTRYNYLADGKVEYIPEQLDTLGQWYSDIKIVTTYNAEGKVVLSEQYSTIDAGKPQLTHKSTTEYIGNLTSRTDYDVETPTYRFDNHAGPYGDTLTMQYNYDEEKGEWKPYSKEISRYNEDGKMVLSHSWYTGSTKETQGIWFNSIENVYHVENGLALTNDLYQFYGREDPEWQSRYSYEYDEKGQLVKEELRNALSNTELDSVCNRTLYFYDEDGDVVEMQYWTQAHDSLWNMLPWLELHEDIFYYYHGKNNAVKSVKVVTKSDARTYFDGRQIFILKDDRRYDLMGREIK